jgi:DNA-binding NtrC family response regulator
VIEADGIEDGMEQLSNGIDAVVADLQSARSTGLEFLRRTKGQQSALCVLAVATRGDVDSAIEAMKSGAADCIVKPVDRKQLLATVSQLLQNRGTRGVGGNSSDPGNRSHIDIPPGTSLEDLERAAVEQALTQHHGNRTHAAKTLGISVRTLQRKLKAWGIPIMGAANSSSASSGNLIFPTHTAGQSSAYSTHAH